MSRTRHREKIEHLTGSKRFSWGCRSHGGCPWCESGRMHKYHRALPADEKEQIEHGYDDYLEQKDD